MAKRNNGGLWTLGAMAAGALLALSARDSEEDTFGKQVSDVVSVLNGRFTGGWVELGLDAMQAAIKPSFWNILAVVVDVERLFHPPGSVRGKVKHGRAKRARAIELLKKRRR